MPTYRLRHLGRAVEVLLRDLVPRVTAAVRDEVIEEGLRELVERSPVASGKYRASHVVGTGSPRGVVLPDLPSYPIPGDSEARAGVRGASPSAVAFIANRAAAEKRPDYSYARHAIEPGRRQYSRRSTRKAQWIGSEQAPAGVYGPTVRVLFARRATIVRNALARIRGRFGR